MTQTERQLNTYSTMNNVNHNAKEHCECSVVDDEDILADDLKKIYRNREETYPKMSAAIFHKLAKIYMKRNPNSDITKRMICLIKSAVLFNAAIIRTPDHVKEIKYDLKKFLTAILHEADAKHKDVDLLKYAKLIAKSIKQMRKKVKQKLNEFKKIPDDIHIEQRQLMEMQKVNATTWLLNDIADDYTNIMASVAQYTEDIMGKPPCEFSLTGMGSLARKEITPYSDFENMILLAHNHSEYETYLNYFRWYSVIYQIILINLQETIVPSVSIKCLNDKNSKHGDWFYDNITTRGICFDGMMPHACKFPLGRQPTDKKPWKTELIKPVNEMLKYLNSEESLKNGYHLSTVLTKTCHVFGNHDVYKEFEKGAQDLIEQENLKTIRDVVTKQITEDLGRFATRQSLLKISPTQQFNVKQVVYRSITPFIAGLGQLYKISAHSCFDILIHLADKKYISENTKQKLLFAVAIACELRLKLYMENEKQSDDVSISTMLDVIGKQSTLRFFQISYALQCDISKRLNLKKVHLYSNPNLLNVSLVHCFDDCDQLQGILHKAKQTDRFSQRYYDFDECFSKMEKDVLQENHQVNHGNTNQIQPNFKSFYEIGNLLMKLEYFDDAFEYFQKCLDTLGYTELHFQEEGLESNKPIQSKPNLMNVCKIARIMFSAGYCLQKVNNFGKAASYFLFSLKLTENCNADNDFASTIQNLGVCFIELNKFNAATKYFKKILPIRAKTSHDTKFDPVYAKTLYEIGRCTYFDRDFENAVPFLEQSVQIRENISADKETDLDIANTSLVLSACLSRLHEQSTAENIFNKAQEICEKAIPRTANLNIVAYSMLWIGHSLMDMHKMERAAAIMEKTLELTINVSLDFTADRAVSDNFYYLGRCYLKLKKATKAKPYFEEALKIDKKISYNPEKDEIIATSQDMIGRCLLNLNKPEEASAYFAKALLIYSKHSHTDRNIANLTSWIGSCNLVMKNVQKAKFYFDRALRIMQKASFHHTTFATSVAHIKLGIGCCLFSMKKCSKAILDLKEALEMFKNASYDNATDSNIANACFWVGRCLLVLNNPKKAKGYFEKALQINIKTSSNFTNNHYVASTKFWIVKCSMNLNKSKKA